MDSTWNGGLIGAAVGVGVLTILGKSQPDSGQGVVFLSVPVMLASIGVSVGIDSLTNKPIYQQPSPTPRVAVAPLLGRDVIGISARVRF